MRAFSLTHLSDPTLLRELATLVARDRTTTAELLAHLAEVDDRKLYLPAGYASLYAYCVGELRMSEQMAFKRIRAARTARRFPVIFERVEAGRLHLCAVVLLAPYLMQETADELLAAAEGMSKLELEQLIARRFPQPDLPTRIESVAPDSPKCQRSPGTVQAPIIQHAPAQAREMVNRLSPGTVEQFAQVSGDALSLTSGPGQKPGRELANSLAPEPVNAPPARVTPLSPDRFALQLTIAKSTHDKLRYAQDLLGHAVPSGDVAEVLDRALDALVNLLEQRKFAATEKPRLRQRSSANKRHVPAHVRRAVWERDRGQCTFVGTNGHRCATRRGLEFDHVDPVARGGRATIGGIRLRCRAHNQYEAERMFGAGFMAEKREAARHGRRNTPAEPAPPPYVSRGDLTSATPSTISHAMSK